MEEARFDAFRAAVRQDNTAPKAAETAAAGRRANKRILRGITPLALAENWITPEQEKDYTALYTVWQRIALGELSGGLSQENLGIVSKNWADMSAVSPSYNSRNFPSEPLLKLIPEGKSEIKRPVFLPAPHEIIARNSEGFRGQSELGDLNVW